jgi:hypothetical protein
MNIIEVNLSYGLPQATFVALASTVFFFFNYFWPKDVCGDVYSGI